MGVPDRLNRLISLVPFAGEKVKHQKENLPREMINKVMELVSVAGFRSYEFTRQHESLSVRTQNGQDKFRAWISGSSAARDKEYYCQVVRINEDKSFDILHFTLSRIYRGGEVSGEALLFSTSHVDRSKRSRDLKKEEWKTIVRLFLASEVDEEASNQEFEDCKLDDGESIRTGRIIVERVVDSRQSSSIIRGFLEKA